MALNEKQQDIINTFINDNLVFVNASAGTGKTTTLVHAYIELLRIKEKIENIVVITFTKAAASEMLKRIRDEVRIILKNEITEEGRLYWLRLYNDLTVKSNITTIDAYVLSLIKDNALEVSMPSKISIINEDDNFFDLLYEALEELFETTSYGEFLYYRYNLYIVNVRKTFIKNIMNLIDKISTRFESIDVFRENVLSMLTLHIDYADVKKNIEESLKDIIDFDYKPKETNTVSGIKNMASSFLELIRKYATFDDIKNMDTKDFFDFYTLLNGLANKKTGNTKAEFQATYEESRGYLLELLNESEKAYSSLQIEALCNFIVDSYEKSVSIKTKNGFYSYDDMLVKVIKVLESDKVGARIRSRVSAVILDEAQDTSRAQFNFICLLLDGNLDDGKISKEKIKKLGKRLFIVGDRKQSIYRFRNTNIKSFLDAQMSFGENVKYLKDNYRSVPPLISFFNDFFLNIVFKDDDINYIEDDNIVSKKELLLEDNNSLTYLRLNQKTKDGTKINADEKYVLEAMGVAKYINDNYREKIKDIAILLPVFSNIDKYIKALSAYNISFYIDGGSGFYSRDEIVHIIYFLRYLVLHEEDLISHLLVSPLFDIKVSEIYEIINDLSGSNLSLDDYFSIYKNETENYLLAEKIILNKPFKNKLINIKNIINSLQKKTFLLNSHSLIECICRETYYYAYLMTESDNELCYANIESLKNISKKYEHQTGRTIYDFVLHLSNNFNAKEYLASVPKLEIDSLHIMTIHKSKGLEFPITFVASLNSTKQSSRGDFNFIDDDIYFNIPLWHSENKFFISNIAKEKDSELTLSERKRLLYVALTRSSENLILSGDISRKDAYIKYLYDYLEEDSSKEPSMFSEDTIETAELIEDKNMKVCLYGRSLTEISVFVDSSSNTLNDINYLKKAYNESPSKKENIEAKKIINVSPSTIYKTNDSYYKNNATENINKLLETKLTYFEEHGGIIEEYDCEKNMNERINPMDLGIILHALFEHFDFDIYKEKKDIYLDNLLEKTVNTLKEYEESYIRMSIKKAINNFATNTHINNIVLGSEILVKREQAFYKSFTDEFGNKNIMNGRIDLITKDKNDNYFILDYKTVEYKEDIYERYKNQLSIYKEFVEDFYSVASNKLFAEILCLK